ncbi:ABC transporter substrate-binding protein [Candidatus Woesearchaeota archaeon]|jgi:branched-chain amino acid transport system substrate-binding protein|nr:ABC transporter substrate-binding protein [bacterium]MBT4207381.1 ABC transporter substrate-binding protein [Candidatus Woesearchaeota archaeon]MBT4731490.1 ABC transporter substrate-binding protein [Candidatus Woesearchaeota archaeon]
MKKIIIGIIVVAVIVTGFALFDKNKDAPSDVIKVGVISILTGDYATVGEGWRNGIILAKENYIKEHPDSKIELIVEDDGFNPKTGLSAYKKLTEVDKVDVLMNASSATIDVIYDLVTKEDFPVIQGGEQGIDPQDDNIFQIMPGNILAEIELGKYTKERHSQNVALVYTNSDFMARFATAFKEGYGDGIDEYKMDPANKDLRTTVSKIIAKNPSAVVVLSVPEQGAVLMKRFSELTTGNKPQFYFDGSFVSGFNDYKRILGNLNYLNGTTIITINLNPSEQYNKIYKERFGSDASVFSDISYDGFNLLMNTYSNSGKKWISNVKKSSFDGVSGAVSFDDFGIRKPSVQIKEIKNGELVDLK